MSSLDLDWFQYLSKFCHRGPLECCLSFSWPVLLHFFLYRGTCRCQFWVLPTSYFWAIVQHVDPFLQRSNSLWGCQKWCRCFCSRCSFRWRRAERHQCQSCNGTDWKARQQPKVWFLTYLTISISVNLKEILNVSSWANAMQKKKNHQNYMNFIHFKHWSINKYSSLNFQCKLNTIVFCIEYKLININGQNSKPKWRQSTSSTILKIIWKKKYLATWSTDNHVWRSKIRYGITTSKIKLKL